MQAYFDLQDVIHLNHAAVGPWPIRTSDAICAFARENSRQGSKDYDRWIKRETELRQHLVKLINASSTDEIALLKSTSEGLSVIAYGLEWNPGDNIVIPAEEFPSNRIVWQSLHSQGVETRLVPVTTSETPEQDLIDAMDSTTRLLSCSSVQYASGFRLDLEQLGENCKKQQVHFCIDGIQSIGALQFDAQAYQADFVVADGHKWMLGPEGCALFYCRSELINSMQLKQFGWHMMKNLFDFDSKEWSADTTARRFESGSPNILGGVGLHASVGLLHEVGMPIVEQKLLENTSYLVERLQAIDRVEVLSSQATQRKSGIVQFIKNGCYLEALYQHLQANNVICALRGKGIRFSPHFYTPSNKIDEALTLVEGFN